MPFTTTSNSNNRTLNTALKAALCVLLLCVIAFFCAGCTKNDTAPNTDTKTTATSSDNEQRNQNKGASEESNLLRVYFFDVGQGDSEFIVLPDDKTILIDAGEADKGQTIVSDIKNLGYSKIDYLVATHPHSDHIGGLPTVIKAFDVGEVWAPKVGNTTKTFETFLDTVSEKNLTISAATRGKVMYDQNNCKVEILSPYENTEYSNLNDWSAIIKITFGNESFLFTGDASSSVISDAKSGTINVLKVGHHGSKTSTNAELIKNLQPQWAVIEVGQNNDYGHPTKKALSALESNNVEILRTDLQGTCLAETDGTTLSWKTEK